MGIKFFISDLHFGAGGKGEKSAESVFENFCNALPSDGELCILGDFFDYWIEYSSVVPAEFTNIYSILLDARKRGVKINFVRGNHDFFKGNFLKTLGIEVFDRHFSFKQNKKKVFCTHGDDIKSGILRFLLSSALRNTFFQFLYKLLPPFFAIRFMKMMSELSRKKNVGNVNTPSRKEKYRRAAFRFIDKKHSSVLVAGHSHICDLAESGKKIYANCGIWSERQTYVEINEKNVFLKEFCGGDLRKDVILEEKEI
ncbi:MAG: UDP-2,3-diacylglucosamine diphosphatase [Chitinivibrionia bacterium]|nr:UDP-2,3-diacylglucosamine diphosphatase [Chitinivibrionia bacterium]